MSAEADIILPAAVAAYRLQGLSPVVVRNDNFDGKIDTTKTSDTPLYRGPLGTPVLTDLTFGAGSYTDNSGKSVQFDKVQLITVLMTVSQSKKIITTEIQGRDGTVKEYIGMGDYEIQIDGIITGKNGAYPVDAVQALKKVLDAPIQVSVISKYLHNLDIYSVVVQEYSFPQEAGGYSQQNFSVKCLSDFPIELQIV